MSKRISSSEKCYEENKHGKDLENGGVGYFGSRVREDFCEKDIFKLNLNNKKKSACRVLGEGISDLTTAMVLRTQSDAEQSEQSLQEVCEAGQGQMP